MKKAFKIILISFLLTGCSENNHDLIDYLNNNDCHAYLFGHDIDDNYGMTNFYKISLISDIKVDNFCVIIDVPNYINYLEKDFINSLYNMLEEENKMMLMFYNAENYDFFKNTHFANEKDYYNDVTLIKSYNNFYGDIKEKGFSSNIKSLETCLLSFASEFRAYRGSL